MLLSMKKVALSIVCLSMVGPVFAATNALEKVREEAAKKFVGRAIISVRVTPIKGIFEVLLSPRQIVYTDSTASYVLVGQLFDVTKEVSLTETRLAELNRMGFSSLPMNHAIKTVRGNGSRSLVVFSDPDCPYCKRLERDMLSKLDNVTIYTFLFPLDHHPDAARKANVIWCAHDKSKAWQDWMQGDKLPTTQNACSAPLDANLALGQKLGVRATPTLSIRP